MLVVAILSILALTAVPAYENYVIRARVSEALEFAEAAKTAVSETMMTQGGLPPDSNEAAGYSFTDSTDNVEDVQIQEGGVITVTTTERAGQGTLILTPQDHQGQITWICQRGTLSSQFLPQNCRGSADATT